MSLKSIHLAHTAKPNYSIACQARALSYVTRFKPWQLQARGRWQRIPDLHQPLPPPIFIAKQACQMVQARLPTENEYEYLSILGDWNGGVSLNHMFWALPDRQVLSPDTRNPTPVRSHAEVQFAPVNFYCVK